MTTAIRFGSVAGLGAVLAVWAGVSTGFAQTRAADDPIQVFSLKEQGDLAVYGGPERYKLGETTDWRYVYRVYFTPNLGEKILVAERLIHGLSGTQPTDFVIKAAAVNGSEVVLVVNSKSRCEAIVTRPTDGGPQTIAPVPPPARTPVSLDELTLGGRTDAATITTRLGHTRINLTRGTATESFTLRAKDGGLLWVKDY